MAKWVYDPESYNKFGDSGNSYHHGETIAAIALTPERGGTSVSPIYIPGWSIPGSLLSVSDTLTKDLLNVEVGSPKIHVVSQVIKVEETVALTFNAFKLPLGAMLANANNIGATLTYGTGDAVVEASPAPTKRKCDIDDKTDFADGDMVEVNLSVSGYGGFKECTFLNGDPIAGTGTVGTVNYDDITYAPASGATFKQVDSIEQYVGGKKLFTCQLLLLTHFQNNEMLYYRYFPKVQITQGTGIDTKTNSEHSTIGFTAKSIPTFVSKADFFGVITKEPITRIDGFISKNA